MPLVGIQDGDRRLVVFFGKNGDFSHHDPIFFRILSLRKIVSKCVKKLRLFAEI